MKNRLHTSLVTRSICALSLAAAAQVSTMQAQLLVSESFDYTVGQNLAGQTGGSGWGGAWTANLNGGGPADIVAQNISAPTGAPAATGNQANIASGGTGNAILSRNMGITINTNVTNEYWFSMRFRRDDASNGGGSENSVFFALNDGAGFDLSIGQGSDEVASIILGGATMAGPTITIGQDYFILARLITNTSGINDTFGVNFYLDSDSIPSEAPTSFDVLVSDDTSFSLNNFLTIQARFAGTLSTDEIRIGQTFGDVVAVPEPNSVALFGLGAAALVAIRRRRRVTAE